jgi:ABC-2 type transport system permease protein
MTGMKDILSLRNREIQVRLLDKSKLAQQKNLWQIINVAVPVLMIILGGVAFSFWRKRIYTLS